MNIIEKHLNEIKPYEKNPRKNDEAVKYVAKSIKEFGFKVPVVIDKDGVIIAGHTRYKAAKKLQLDTVPCIIADDLTEEQIKAFRLADNKVSEKAEWDIDLLSEELNDILELDMADFGFEDVLQDLEDSAEAEEDDFVAELPEEPNSKLGQVYKLGNHRLMCGDSTDPAQVEKLMGGAESRLITDGPTIQCGLYRQDQGCVKDRKRQDGRFKLPSVFKRCVFLCRQCYERGGCLLYMACRFRRVQF